MPETKEPSQILIEVLAGLPPPLMLEVAWMSGLASYLNNEEDHVVVINELDERTQEISNGVHVEVLRCAEASS